MPGPLITVNRARHALAVTIGWGRPDTDPAGLGLPLAVARELHGASPSQGRAPEVATTASRPAARRKPRARVRG
ncbi:hypothetical protein ABZ916_43105 [Streptomyces sp. NPDC046853]|uniref:hypothetical protein n=1 Tax=Streptomyces sp. NPDC046853 TaxID=3154920 RepID=UPI0033DEE1F4